MTIAAAQAGPDSNPALQMEEIRRLIKTDLPALPPVSAPAPLGGYGPVWAWLAAGQHKKTPALVHPRLALFLAAHGGEADIDLPALLAAYQQPLHPVAALAAAANADLQIYEMEMESGNTPAPLSVNQTLQALAYGMMAVKPGLQLLLIALPNPAAAAAGADIEQRLKAGEDALDALMAAGGTDIAAALGAALAARLAQMPVAVEGPAIIIRQMLESLAAGAGLHIKDTDDILPLDLPLPPGGRAALLLPFLKSLCAIGV